MPGFYQVLAYGFLINTENSPQRGGVPTPLYYKEENEDWRKISNLGDRALGVTERARDRAGL